MTMIGGVPRSEVGPVLGVGDDNHAQFGTWWMNWFNQVYNVLFAVQQSGNTASRPVKNIWVGRCYFDTDLTKPIWVKQATPAVVWCDATGATV